ncbi:MAG: class I SAM-dependent methyltransferase, partial [Acidobacteria bacterium]|nr:class I SAM-dependent methyltransferase [Acidobacteriota bacterium]
MAAVNGEDFDPYWLAFELALAPLIFVPGFPTVTTGVARALIGARAVARTGKISEFGRPVLQRNRARVIEKARKVAEAAEIRGLQLADESGQISPAAFFGRDAEAERVFRVGEAEASLAPAKSVLGQWWDAAFDAARPYTSKLQFIKSREQMLGHAAGKREKDLQTFGRRYTESLNKLRLRLEDFYAIRMVARQINADEATKFHLGEIDSSPGKLGESLHSIHAAGFERARQWVDMLEDGTLALNASAPDRVHQALALVEGAGKNREQILEELELLTRRQIRERVEKEQRVFNVTVENPPELVAELMSSPARQRAFRWAQETGLGKEFMETEDRRALRYHQLRTRALRDELETIRKGGAGSSGMPEEVLEMMLNQGLPADLYYRNLGALGTEFPEAIKDWLRRQFGGISTKIHPHHFGGRGDDIYPGDLAQKYLTLHDASEIKIPKELRDPKVLTQTIERVYRLAGEGEAMGGRTWFARAAENIRQFTDEINQHPRIFAGQVQPVTYDQVTQIFALLSRRADTVSNVDFAQKAVTQWIEYGEVYAGRYPSREADSILNVLKGSDWDGRKRSSFYNNIIEELYPEMADPRRPVTVDMHVARMFGLGEQPGASYDFIERLVQDMAASVGWQPKEFQGSAWVAFKNHGLEAELKRNGRRNVRHIAGAGDAFEYGLAHLKPPTLFAGVHPRALAAADLLKGAGKGFTLKTNLTPANLKTGYMVAYGAYETLIPIGKFAGAHVEAFRDAHKELLTRGNYLGGYQRERDGIAVLEISRRFTSKEEAIKFARQQGQEEIYDLATARKGDLEGAFIRVMDGEEADRIKLQLRGASEEKYPRIPDSVPITPPEVTALDRAIETYIVERGWPRNATSRRLASESLPPELIEAAQAARENTYPSWAQLNAREEGGIRSGEFSDFFTEANRGEHAPIVLPRWRFFDPEHQEFYDDIRRYAGGFDDHIETSIPDYRGVQVRKGAALVRAFPGDSVLDLMGSTGAWIKALALRGMPGVNLDANAEMMRHFNQNPVEGARFEDKAFQESFDGFEHYDPVERFDIVNESMGFQFISPDRDIQIAEAKRLMNEGGLFITDEKVVTQNWDAFEQAKDAWKGKFYPQEAIEKKREILGDENVTGMRANMVSQEELEATLSRHFRHVAPYWESGNFRGYVASDDPYRITKFFEAYRAEDVPVYSPRPNPRVMLRELSPQADVDPLARVKGVAVGPDHPLTTFPGRTDIYGIPTVATRKHELQHFWDYHDPELLRKLGFSASSTDDEIQEMLEYLADHYELYLMEGGPYAGMPEELNRSFESVGRQMETETGGRVYDEAGNLMEDPVPPHIRDMFDSTFFLVRGDPFYIPEVPGLPAGIRNPIKLFQTVRA